MAYVLEAVIGPADLIRREVEGRPAAVVVPLPQGLALVPMTDAFFDAVTDGASTAPLGFWKLPGGFDRVLATWSAAGPVAYVEADFFGGAGSQRAAVWSGGDLVLGPLGLDEVDPVPDAGTPISRALRRLGVDRHGHDDEFEAVDLHRHRETDEWRP